MTVRPYVPGDYAHVAQAAGWPVWSIAQPEHAFTAEHEGVPIACAGLVLHWRGLASAWALFADEARRHSLPLHRAVLRGLDTLTRQHGLRRVEATTREDYVTGQAWLERLGFRLEGRMPHYGPDGETHLRYVKFFGVRR